MESLFTGKVTCDCGYSTRDGYEAKSHINVQAQRRKDAPNHSEDAHENGACDKQHQELQAVTDEMAARYAVLRYGIQGDGRTLANAGGVNAISSEMSYCRSALNRILGISQPASRDLTGWNEEYFESTVNKVLELWRNSETNKTVKEQQ